MNFTIRQTARNVALVAIAAVGLTYASGELMQASASPAVVQAKAPTAQEQALATLMSFYKPALQGQFPGSVKGLTIGKSTRTDVAKLIGKAEDPGKDADDFDVYHASMGNPGYAIGYKLNKIREMRYFGTNVERETNIGGITLKMLKQHWYKPTSTTTIKNGKLVQQKVVYNRGDYVLSFIFNDATHLDHINLTAKASK